jgi:hypothetical protein
MLPSARWSPAQGKAPHGAGCQGGQITINPLNLREAEQSCFDYGIRLCMSTGGSSFSASPLPFPPIASPATR